ncbi:amidase [Chryseosolibacter indicus]|uniref:Amidase n=1 Tax=Chryseosolibacter indicus TaxID=2782351 RepID=A0ABS5VLS8_9BACT|nr:amidase [Chryseosolibacter indicus]MBT1702408.1 amidase [Chryseosolibacter indicus]
MKRRDFIKQTSYTALTLQAFLLSCNSPSNSKEKPHGKQTENAIAKFELSEATVMDLQRMMEEGKYTAQRIAELYIRRIQEVDKDGPRLNSVIEINPEAIQIATQLDEERKSGKVRGPLHGIPVLIKDNIDTGDKMMTTAGSLALNGHHAMHDAFLVKKLREAGAVILGKTNLSEWANFRSTRSSSGWSSRGGQTKNPYVLNRNPCGSSSGSGTAVSANLCTIAIGTETNGSIACPSSINGVVGLKPTVGLVSRSGIIPISHTQDTAGPMTRTVADAAILLGVIAGADEADKVTLESKGKAYADYTKYLDPNALQGKKIGVEKSFLKEHEAVDALLREALDIMKSKGAEIVEVDFRSKVNVGESEFDLLQFEFKDGLNRYFSQSHTPVKSLKELIDFNNRHADKVMPFFKQEILEMSEEREDLQSKAYKEALNKVISTRSLIDKELKQHGIEAICGPANGPSWCIDLVNGDHFTGYGMYSAAAMAGYPHITVPMGLVKGLPIGLTFIASAYQEPQLIGIAYAFEQASKLRAVPEFKESLV